MKKEHFFTLILLLFGGLLFSIGLCMCLLPQWNAFSGGVVMTTVGAALLILLLVRTLKERGISIRWNGRRALRALVAVGGVLMLGLGMAMVMVWNLPVYGILVGLAGIALLVALIPLVKGLK